MGRNGSADQDGSQQEDLPSDGQGGGETTDTATGWIEVESIKESQDTDDIHYL